MATTVVDWKTCEHEWSMHESVCEPDFNVAFGSNRVCKKCRAVEFENWCETRASGGKPKIYPPDEVN